MWNAAKRWSVWVPCVVLAIGITAAAQFGGNANYGQAGARARAEQAERARRSLTREELPPTEQSLFVEASVLMNVKPDTYVATFGVTGEGETVEAAQAKLDATIGPFVADLTALGLAPEDVTTDFTAQTKLYRFEVAENRAREKLAGFEIKKTVSATFHEKEMLDRLLAAGAKRGIHDLIRVDSLVADPESVQEEVADAAADVLQAKVERYRKRLGIPFVGVPQIYAERPAIHFPADLYDSYESGEGDAIEPPPARDDVPGFVVERVRRGRTFYYNPLTADGYDRVINPVVSEPVVQFTLYLKAKLRYDAGGQFPPAEAPQP
jgi:uncharacterized protein YggE